MYRHNPTNIEVHEAAASAEQSGGKTARVVIGGVLVAGGVSGLIWWYLQRKKAQEAAQALPQTQTGTQAIQIAPGLMSQSPVLQYIPADQLGAQEIEAPANVPPPAAQPTILTLAPGSTPAPTTPGSTPPSSPFQNTAAQRASALRGMLPSAGVAMRFGR